MDTIEIDDPDDVRLEPYRDIRERDLVGRRGLFVAEGKVVVDMLLSAEPFQVQSVLVAASRVEAIRASLAAAHAQPPVYVVPQMVMDAIAGFPVHRGILAIGARPDETGHDDLLRRLPEKGIVVAAIGIANHDNVGAIFRNAAAFGAAAVLLDRTSCDPLYRKAIRVSVGAVFSVPYVRTGSAADVLSSLESFGFQALALSPAGAETIRATARAPRTALVVGTEGDGLPFDLLARMKTVRIPMAQGLDSLNVATSVAIALYELSGARA